MSSGLISRISIFAGLLVALASWAGPDNRSDDSDKHPEVDDLKFMELEQVRKLPRGSRSLREKMGIYTLTDMLDYYRMHSAKVKKLSLVAFDKHWLEVADFFGVPVDKSDPIKMHETKQKLRRVLEAVLNVHDHAKLFVHKGAMARTHVAAASGLMMMLGVEIRNMPEGPAQRAARAYVDGVNALDAKYSRQELIKALKKEGFKVSRAIGDFMTFFEKTGDFVERGLDPDGSLETDSDIEPPSRYSEQKLATYLHPPKDDTGARNDRGEAIEVDRYLADKYRGLFRKVVRTPERGHRIRVAGMNHRKRIRERVELWRFRERLKNETCLSITEYMLDP